MPNVPSLIKGESKFEQYERKFFKKNYPQIHSLIRRKKALSLKQFVEICRAQKGIIYILEKRGHSSIYQVIDERFDLDLFWPTNNQEFIVTGERPNISNYFVILVGGKEFYLVPKK
jgi:hypothetical protein